MESIAGIVRSFCMATCSNRQLHSHLRALSAEGGNCMNSHRLLLNDSDLTRNAWVGEDFQQRIEFLEALAQRSLPMPQNEGQFHASRVYIDSRGESEYSIEQWLDYLRLHDYSV
eukprot:TRINITY_DN103198_c0_g1_i1.p2 TRINITY_DN103198_c0_g1~~TRINITY_DN103198_c0_g1_i1.p2  ORF type:complete len:114 (-),score=14.87 TRINITY_DN103198_c0_g1_i1:384-725(-)